jgi:hypothetical protein
MTPLALDAVQQWFRLGEARSRRAVWERREGDPVGDGAGLRRCAVTALPRPTAVPAGPVERCAEQTSLTALLGAAGLAAWSRNVEQAAQAVLATAPKAAGAGREAFCAVLGRDLARAGAVPMNPAALRVLDRVSAVVIDSRSLCVPRVRLLSVTAGQEQVEVYVWQAAEAVLAGRTLKDMTGPGPWAAGDWRLRRRPDTLDQRPDAASGLRLEVLDVHGRLLGCAAVGCDLDPLADAVIAAAGTTAMDQPAPALMGPALARLLAIRGTATTLTATAAWQTGRLTGRARRADTMGLAALITAQLGQTLITDWRSPLVLVTTALSTAALLTVVQTPGLSHFFGCTPPGPIAWATVAASATTATLTAVIAPRLLTRAAAPMRTSPA